MWFADNTATGASVVFVKNLTILLIDELSTNRTEINDFKNHQL